MIEISFKKVKQALHIAWKFSKV